MPILSTAVAQGGGGGGPYDGSSSDLTTYIFRLEQQNEELRAMIAAQQAAGFGTGGPSGGALVERSEESKRAFLTDVLAQVENVITAHRNKAAAEIQRYKHEAEAAQLALKNMRQAIQQEGMDLSMAPAMIAFHRKQQSAAAAAAAAGGPSAASAAVPSLGLTIPDEAQRLLDGVASDLLGKLGSVQSSDDVPRVVQQAVKIAFESIIVHFTDQLCANTKFLDEANALLKKDLAEAREDARRTELMHEGRRIELVTRHDAEIQALRDEIMAFQRASGGDDVVASIHQKAFDDYASLLVDARREAATARQELENERNHSAQVCLKLKAALQKRNDDFEKAVLARAEDVVQQRDRQIAELEARLREKAPPKREFADFASQAGESNIHIPTAEAFVPSLMAGRGRDGRGTAAAGEQFERDVWRKTQELLAKYGR